MLAFFENLLVMHRYACAWVAHVSACVLMCPCVLVCLSWCYLCVYTHVSVCVSMRGWTCKCAPVFDCLLPCPCPPSSHLPNPPLQLHEVAEIKLRAMREEYQAAGAIPSDVFQDFRKRLIGLTDVTHSFFDKLVKQLEKGFAGIERDFAGELPASQGADGAGPSGSGSGGAGPSSARGDGASGSGGGGSGSGGGGGAGRKRRGGGTSRAAGEDLWVCHHCTLSNNGGSDCEACGLPRPD